MPIENESFYEIALNEIESNNYSRGLWAKCFSEAMGVESVTKAIYIKYRVEQLQQEFNANQSKPLKDTIGGENIDSRTKWNCPFCRNSNTFNNTAICSICRQSNPDLESHGEIVNSNLDSDCLNRQSSSGPHPWHRWFARVLDHYFFSFPITMALVKIVPIHVSH